MIDITIDAKAIVADLDRIIDGLQDAVTDGLDATAMAGRQEAMARSKGSVRKSIVVERDRNDVSLSALAPHAKYVEYGRGPIKAKEGSFLRFVSRGRVIYAKSVGPAKPHPFMGPARVIMNDTRLIERSIEELIRGA